MKKDKVWYEISAGELALKATLTQLNLSNKPSPGDDSYDLFVSLMKINLAKSRGIKYGVESYSLMYMKERETVLGNWQVFFSSFCRDEKISTTGKIFVGGVNDGQEVYFFQGMIVGVDMSLDAISRGSNLYNHIHFILGDLTSFALKENSLDSYISLRTIHFFSEYEKEIIIKNAFRFMKKGGRILISIPGGFLDKTDQIVFGQMVSDGHVNTKKPMEDSMEIFELITNAGFSKTTVINHEIEIFLVGEK